MRQGWRATIVHIDHPQQHTTCTYLDEVHEYTFDPRDRVRQVTKKAASNGAVLETENYTHDANNNVISQTIENQTTTFSYDRDRLVSSTTGAIVAKHNYDPFGRLNTITSAGQIIESYTYDGFDRTATHKKLDGGTLKTTSYVYDPLDRTAAKTEQAGTPSATGAITATTATAGPPSTGTTPASSDRTAARRSTTKN